MKKMKLKIKRPISRINLKKELRISIITLLGILILASSYTAFAAHQTPTTIEQITPAYGYTHTGTYDYKVYLTNNSLYATNVLLPGQGTFFKKIVDHINASYTYNFIGNKQAEIQGTYKITAQVQTNLWSKTFEITPSTRFNSNSSQARFITDFPINVTIYENYLAKVNEETGTTAQESTLIIQCSVSLYAHVADGNVNEEFSSSLQIPLGGSILEINENLTTGKYGAIETTQTVEQPGVKNQRTTYASSSLVFLIALVLFAIFTKSEIDEETRFKLELKKINKKYGEWIVESKGLQPNTASYLENITVNSLDDLIKISEEMGKPIIRFINEQNEHIFYIYDENLQYQYKLTFKEKNNSI